MLYRSPISAGMRRTRSLLAAVRPRAALGALALGLAVGGLGLTAPAAAQGRGGTAAAAISLNQANPYLGEWVSFTASVPSPDKDPRIVVNCYRNGALVWGQLGLTTDSYKLGGDSSPWLAGGGGPATCRADLVNQVWNGNNQEQLTTLASTSFAVSG